MPHIDELEPYFPLDIINAQIDHEQLAVLHKLFVADFIDSKPIINGKTIYIDERMAEPKEYSNYTKTFYHIITRTIKTYRDRFYECERANRIHWIRPILESHPCKDILYYKWRDPKGLCREHFWLVHKKFMVVLADTAPGKQIVTSFCVDDGRKDDYFLNYATYRDGKCDCP